VEGTPPDFAFLKLYAGNARPPDFDNHAHRQPSPNSHLRPSTPPNVAISDAFSRQSGIRTPHARESLLLPTTHVRLRLPNTHCVPPDPMYIARARKSRFFCGLGSLMPATSPSDKNFFFLSFSLLFPFYKQRCSGSAPLPPSRPSQMTWAPPRRRFVPPTTSRPMRSEPSFFLAEPPPPPPFYYSPF